MRFMAPAHFGLTGTFRQRDSSQQAASRITMRQRRHCAYQFRRSEASKTFRCMRASEVGQGDSRGQRTRPRQRDHRRRAFSRDKVARQPHRSVRSDFRGRLRPRLVYARWYGMGWISTRRVPDRSRRSVVEYSWDRPFRTLLACIKKDEPALPAPLVVHVSRQLRRAGNILSL